MKETLIVFAAMRRMSVAGDAIADRNLVVPEWSRQRLGPGPSRLDRAPGRSLAETNREHFLALSVSSAPPAQRVPVHE